MLPLWLLGTMISTASASAADDDTPMPPHGWRAFGLVLASGLAYHSLTLTLALTLALTLTLTLSLSLTLTLTLALTLTRLAYHSEYTLNFSYVRLVSPLAFS